MTSDRVIGRYVVLREIGRGGMAVVYLADQTDLRRQVALKELSSFHASDEALAARFLREAQLSGSLTHPNIVTVHEYLEHDGVPYIAMEYCPRGSLRTKVHDITLAQVAGVVEGVLAALAAAESRGIVHRDLKPENLMVTTDGGVKITDFGIAKALDTAAAANLTQTGSTVGTPHYMAPEQAMGLEVGTYTDLYSVGVMTFEMLTGRVPYAQTATAAAVLLRQVNEPVEPLAGLRPDLDPNICAWVDTMVSKDPANRPSTASEAWLQFEDAILGVLGPRWRRRARLLASPDEASTAKPLTPAPFRPISVATVDGSSVLVSSTAGTVETSPRLLQPVETVAPKIVDPTPSATTIDTPETPTPTPSEAPSPPPPPKPYGIPQGLGAPGGDTALRFRTLGLLLLGAAAVAAAIAAGALLVAGGSKPKKQAAPGLHAVAGRAVNIGTRRVVLAGSPDGTWLMKRGAGLDSGTISPVDAGGQLGTPITLGGIPAGMAADGTTIWALEASGYRHQQVFMERLDTLTGEVAKVASFPSRELPCVTNGAIDCNPLVNRGRIWTPVGSTLYWANLSKPGVVHAVATGGPIWDIANGEDRIWVISGKSLLRVDPTSSSVTHVLGPASFPGGVQPFHVSAGDGHVWVSASGRGVTPNGRLLSINTAGGGRPHVVDYPDAGTIAVHDGVLWVERYNGHDELRALDAATGHPLGPATALRSDVTWLVPLSHRLLVSTFEADTGERAVVPLSVVG